MNILPLGNGAVPPGAAQTKPQPLKPNANAQPGGHSAAPVGGSDGDGDHGVEPGQSHGGVNVQG
jgi:hypothetical protein